MRTPDFQDSPLSITPIVDGSISLRVDSDSLDSNVYLTVFDSSTGKEALVPAELVSMIVKYGTNASNQMASEKEKARIRVNHPSHYTELDSVSKDNERQLVYKGTSASIELTPVISWYNNNNKDINDQGWKLYLVGAEDVTLSKARWDDVAGIKEMTEAISNPKSLFSIVALINPALAKKLSARSLAVTLKKNRSIPKMEISDLRKIFTEAELNSNGDSRYNAGGLGNLSIKINNKEVRIAIKIRRPAHPLFVKSDFVIPKGTEYAKAEQLKQERKESINAEWDKRFKDAIKNTDWRIVDLREPSTTQYRNYYNDNCFWVTRIPGNDWLNLLDAAVEASKERGYGTSARF